VAVEGYVADASATTIRMVRDEAAVLTPGMIPSRTEVDALVAIRDRAANALSALQPPDEMAPEHRLLAGELARFVEAARGFLADTEGLDPEGFEEALLASTELDLVADSVSAACTAWEARARQLGHPADLGC
jgi:hypothetical protein